MYILIVTFFTHLYFLTCTHALTFLHNNAKVPQFLNSNSLTCSA